MTLNHSDFVFSSFSIVQLIEALEFHLSEQKDSGMDDDSHLLFESDSGMGESCVTAVTGW